MERTYSPTAVHFVCFSKAYFSFLLILIWVETMLQDLMYPFFSLVRASLWRDPSPSCVVLLLLFNKAMPI